MVSCAPVFKCQPLLTTEPNLCMCSVSHPRIREINSVQTQHKRWDEREPLDYSGNRRARVMIWKNWKKKEAYIKDEELLALIPDECVSEIRTTELPAWGCHSLLCPVHVQKGQTHTSSSSPVTFPHNSNPFSVTLHLRIASVDNLFKTCLV